MSVALARRRRTELFASIAALLLIVGLVSLISVEDPNGATLRIGIIMVTLGAGLWMTRSWELIPLALLTWLAPNFGRSVLDDRFELFSTTMMLEAAGVLAIAGVASIAREALKALEEQSILIGEHGAGVNPETGVFEASQLRPAVESELARSRRFGRTFSLVVVGIDEMRQKYDYRDPAVWEASLAATARLLRNTRHNVDRVFHYGDNGFAIVLPESSEKDVVGMVRRLRRLARIASPAEGEPGGPLPAHFGATFFPACATTVEDLFRRADVALKIAEKNTLRYQLDSAEAPQMPPAETLRRPEDEEVVAPVDVAAPVASVVAEAEELVATMEPVAEIAPVEALEPEDEASGEAILAFSASEDEVPIEVYAEAIATETEASVEVSEPEPVFSIEKETSRPAPIASLDDIDALLKQMDETLSMIRSVRAKAA